ncbi:MAG: DUF2959 domain-containing protein [Alphaproteobacteria bacterium]|nr:DNA repair protein [Hyphomonas sp.]MBR9806203.1 DUF2959 domain-containing protein [Alphaproteobacteria bacterium]|tara:strand:- start:446 stop:1108 length:663 start_codon:yes stop_codon:yes gene_type:complete
MTIRLRAAMLAAFLATSSVAGCSTAYYGAMEQFGYQKRDLLVSRVNEAAAAQEEAKVEFNDALEAFRSVVALDGGELEASYDRLSKTYDQAEDKAQKVRDRIKSMKGVSRDLFVEWRKELEEYSDPELRRVSAQQLEDTRERYGVLVQKMDRAAESMDPVLAVFHDRVLFLKHNLNARAIAALSNETRDIETDVAELIAEMERSIAEADAFIQEMTAGGV